MNRSRAAWLAAAASEVYDVLVVGGGITGAGIVRDAAGRGLACLLVDKADFASGTSSRSGKLVHGGLRYLKHGHFRLVFEACRERWLLWRRVAPHLVVPVQFVVPFYRGGRTPRWLMLAGLMMYHLLALGRNVGWFRVWSARRTLAAEPALDPRGLKGGLAYWDCSCLDLRLVIDTLKSAAQNGAHLLNYVELLAVERSGGLWHARLRDHLTGREWTARARTVVNATGPWADTVQDRCAERRRFGLRLSAGTHVVVSRRRLPVRHTVVLEVAEDRRMIYLVPWGEQVLIGTTDRFWDAGPDQAAPSEHTVAYLLAAANRYFPAGRLTSADVLARFAGVRPLIGSDQGVNEDRLPRDDQMIEHPGGLVAITGGKLTTYRAMAARVVDLLAERWFAERRLPRAATDRPISGGESACPADASPRLAALWGRYGANARQVEALIAEHPALGLEQPVVSGAPFLRAELRYAVEVEFATSADDVVSRRWGAFLLAPACELHEPVTTLWREYYTPRRDPTCAETGT